MIATTFPTDDWQFYVATAITLVAFGFLVRPFLERKKKATGCAGCPSGAARDTKSASSSTTAP